MVVDHVLLFSPSDNTAFGKFSTQVYKFHLAEPWATDAVCTNVKYDMKSKPAENIISQVIRNPI